MIAVCSDCIVHSLQSVGGERSQAARVGGFGRVTGTGECSPAAGWCEWVAGGFLVYPGVREEVRQMASAGAGSAGVEVARGGVMNSPRYAGNGRRAGRLAALGAGVVVRKKAASAQGGRVDTGWGV